MQAPPPAAGGTSSVQRPPPVVGRILTNADTGAAFKLYVRKTRDNRGMGLFTAEHLEVVTAPRAVSVYGGLYLTENEADELYRTNKQHRYSYLHAVDAARLPAQFRKERWFLDGTRRRDPNLTIYCNEPNNSQLVNATIGYDQQNASDPTLYLYVIRSVPAGGELLIDYGEEYDRTYAGYGPSTGYVPWHQRDCEERLRATLKQQINIIRSSPEQRRQEHDVAAAEYDAFWIQYSVASHQPAVLPDDIPEVPPPKRRLELFREEERTIRGSEQARVRELLQRNRKLSEPAARALVEEEMEAALEYLQERIKKAEDDLIQEGSGANKAATAEEDVPKPKKPKHIQCYLYYRYRHYHQHRRS
jgi:hypothetical protein